MKKILLTLILFASFFSFAKDPFGEKTDNNSIRVKIMFDDTTTAIPLDGTGIFSSLDKKDSFPFLEDININLNESLIELLPKDEIENLNGLLKIETLINKQFFAVVKSVKNFINSVIICMYNSNSKDPEKYYECSGKEAKQIFNTTKIMDNLSHNDFMYDPIKPWRLFGSTDKTKINRASIIPGHGCASQPIRNFAHLLKSNLGIQEIKCELEGVIFKSKVCYIKKY